MVSYLSNTAKFSYLPYMAPSFGLTALECHQDLASEQTRVSGLPCGIVCAMISLAVLIEHRFVTDGQTDGTADARR